jgi:uncharacterized protein
LNNANAMYSIGVLYTDGLGVQQDYGKAREWYEKSAAGDNVFAMENLGVLYAQALGVPRITVKRASGTRRPRPWAPPRP